LIELLVVVAIITILIALLLPVLSRARQEAVRVKCSANLRSIGQALTMYTQQYGCYPAGRCTNRGMNFAIWPTRLRPFAGGSEAVFNCPAQDERCEWKKGQSTPGPLAGEVESHYGYEFGERVLMQPPLPGAYFFSYGYNGQGAQEIGSVKDGTHKGLGFHIVHEPSTVLHHEYASELRASRVRVPSEMIAVGDATAEGGDDYYIAPVRYFPGAPPGSIHRGGANVLFCDGHVEWFLQRDLVLPLGWEGLDAAERARFLAIARRWNNDHKAGDWDG